MVFTLASPVNNLIVFFSIVNTLVFFCISCFVTLELVTRAIGEKRIVSEGFFNRILESKVLMRKRFFHSKEKRRKFKEKGKKREKINKSM